jgi:hypothetical protein
MEILSKNTKQMFLYLLLFNFAEYNTDTKKSSSFKRNHQDSSNKKIDLDKESKLFFNYLKSQENGTALKGNIVFEPFLICGAICVKQRNSSDMMGVQMATFENLIQSDYDYVISNGFKFITNSNESYFFYLNIFDPLINTDPFSLVYKTLDNKNLIFKHK